MTAECSAPPLSVPFLTARDRRRVRDGKHRLVCRRCGHTEDVGCAIGDQPCLTPARTAGFAVDEAEVVFWGLCPTCKS